MADDRWIYLYSGLLTEAALAGGGITLMSPAAQRPYLSSGKLVRMLASWESAREGSLYLVYPGGPVVAQGRGVKALCQEFVPVLGDVKEGDVRNVARINARRCRPENKRLSSRAREPRPGPFRDRSGERSLRGPFGNVAMCTGPTSIQRSREVQKAALILAAFRLQQQNLSAVSKQSVPGRKAIGLSRIAPYLPSSKVSGLR